VIDLTTAVQNAVFAALKAHVPAQLGGAHDHVKQDTPPPFNKIGAIEVANEGGKGEQRERFVIEVHSIHRGNSRAPLLAQAHAVRVALHDRELAAPGVAFSTPNWIDGAISDAGADGVTYAAINTFEVFAEPA
jgi:hypothetical protein